MRKRANMLVFRPGQQACAQAAEEVSKPGWETGPATDDVTKAGTKAIGQIEFRGKGKLSLPQYFLREQKRWEWVEGAHFQTARSSAHYPHHDYCILAPCSAPA